MIESLESRQLLSTTLAGDAATSFAYEPDFRGGVSVAAGDVNGDTFIDVITAPAPSGGPRVSVFSSATGDSLPVGSDAYDPAFLGGIYVVSADVDLAADDTPDIIVSADRGGGPHVR